MSAEAEWTDVEGRPISCREKLKMLAENQVEAATMLRDAFEDGVLMGVDPALMRRRLHALVDALVDPRAPVRPA